MMPLTATVENEKGFVLVVTMVILMLLVVLGLSANTSSTLEEQIAGNARLSQMAFFHADAGVYASPKVISAAIAQGGDPSSTLFDSSVTHTVSGTPSFYDEIMGFDPPQTNPEFTFSLDSGTVKVHIVRAYQKVLAGGGAEFASGASGVGSGSTGGVAVYYNLDSAGQAPAATLSEVLATYRKVPGTAGGL